MTVPNRYCVIDTVGSFGGDPVLLLTGPASYVLGVFGVQQYMSTVSYGTILEHHLAVVAIRQSVVYTQIITVIVYCELVGLGWFHVQTVGA